MLVEEVSARERGWVRERETETEIEDANLTPLPLPSPLLFLLVCADKGDVSFPPLSSPSPYFFCAQTGREKDLDGESLSNLHPPPPPLLLLRSPPLSSLIHDAPEPDRHAPTHLPTHIYIVGRYTG